VYQKILVPLDGSKASEAILPYVTKLAASLGAGIVLLRVVTLPVLEIANTDFVPPLSTSETSPDLYAQAEAYLERIALDYLPSDLQVSHHVMGGGVADAILEDAAATEADLIAMSTHGRGGLARMVMGSVADEIVRRSHLPVLLIRPDEH
jgi:nucleotide-binding universal stress UspA family protein